MNIALFHSVWTVLLLILFVGIVLWAYSSRRQQRFDAAARLPLEDEDAAPAHPSGEKHHG
jgi:cytochrome c oxidase cbb3-type subunit 4